MLVCRLAVDVSAGTVADHIVDGLHEDTVRHHGGRGMLMWILWILQALLGLTDGWQLDFFLIQKLSCVGSVMICAKLVV